MDIHQAVGFGAAVQVWRAVIGDGAVAQRASERAKVIVSVGDFRFCRRCEIDIQFKLIGPAAAGIGAEFPVTGTQRRVWRPAPAGAVHYRIAAVDPFTFIVTVLNTHHAAFRRAAAQLWRGVIGNAAAFQRAGQAAGVVNGINDFGHAARIARHVAVFSDGNVKLIGYFALAYLTGEGFRRHQRQVMTAIRQIYCRFQRPQAGFLVGFGAADHGVALFQIHHGALFGDAGQGRAAVVGHFTGVKAAGDGALIVVQVEQRRCGRRRGVDDQRALRRRTEVTGGIDGHKGEAVFTVGQRFWWRPLPAAVLRVDVDKEIPVAKRNHYLAAFAHF